MWKVKKIISKGDYNYCLVPDHPNSTKNGYMLEHRIVIENHLSRLLNSNEVVHHKNGDRKDNRLNNLEVLTNKEHARLHGIQRGKTMVELICPFCQLKFIRQKKNTHLSKKKQVSTFCSRRCSASFYRHIQLHGITSEMQCAISVNIVRVYHTLDNAEETN